VWRASAIPREVSQDLLVRRAATATGSVRRRIVPLGFLSRRAQKVIGPWELRKEPTPSETTPAEAVTAKNCGIRRQAEPRERFDPTLENWHQTKVRPWARSPEARLAAADEAEQEKPPGFSGE